MVRPAMQRHLAEGGNGRPHILDCEQGRYPAMTMGEEADGAGLVAILVANRAKLLQFFTSRTRDPGEAEDIVQEMVLRLSRVAEGPIADPMAYLYRIGLNIVIDRSRARQRRTQREEQWSDMTTQRIGDDAIDDTPSAFHQLAERQRNRQIADAIASMPPGAARAFRLHKIDGLSHREVAEQLGISRKGVEKHMAVAFRHLTKELKE